MLLTTVNKEYDDYDYDRDYKYDDDSITGDALWSLPLSECNSISGAA